MDKKLEDKWKEVLERKDQGKTEEKIGLSIILYVWILVSVSLAGSIIYALLRKMKAM